MKRLWAPWRYDYVSGNQENDGECFVCRAAGASPTAFRENLVLERTSRAIALLNRFPYNTGHLLLAPLRHVAEPEDLDDDEMMQVWRLVCKYKKKLEATSKPNGFNVGINLGQSAGAGLPGHIHMHIVPRWTGDTNFMSVLSETKVMPESLDDVMDRLLDGQSQC